MFTSKSQKKISIAVFGLYILLLIWLILFKFNINLTDLGYIRNVNLIPFKESLIINGHLDVSEIIYNVLIFVPLGVYVSIFTPKLPFIKKILPSLFLSLLLETLQFIFAIGASDITDVISNTVGGFLGIILFHFFKKLFREKFISIVNLIGLMIEIFALIMLIFLLVANR